ncbi:hypothetical protein AVEN_18223-1 [Araneus ventricosus]|uniref:Uncharacterized protein n=1 Tax=Araneus ventricosus TaxID=182803 RepID=A0A4Y2AKC1_ARAVE|nr:hypothetical protein AVEN_18223-1 [Araneus ventricosus]
MYTPVQWNPLRHLLSSESLPHIRKYTLTIVPFIVALTEDQDLNIVIAQSSVQSFQNVIKTRIKLLAFIDNRKVPQRNYIHPAVDFEGNCRAGCRD